MQWFYEIEIQKFPDFLAEYKSFLKAPDNAN